MNFNFILTAAGNVSLPQLTIMLFEKTQMGAIDTAQSHAQTLSKAGYFNFWLSMGADASPIGSLVDESKQVNTGRLSVKVAEPVASFTAAK